VADRKQQRQESASITPIHQRKAKRAAQLAENQQHATWLAFLIGGDMTQK
jgi:hypothetical protein